MSAVAERADESPGSTEDLLIALRTRGFQFIDPRDAGGEVVAVVGVRAHDNVIDVVRLHSEDQAIASRMPCDEADILAPREVFWQHEGPVLAVLGSLLCLPDDRTAGSLRSCR
jgi:hypothetical protein